MCRCGHHPGAHEHYRRGSDCGSCGPLKCPRMRPDRWRRTRDVTSWASASLRTWLFWRRHTRARRTRRHLLGPGQ